nr:oligopeptide transporter [Tanacetum cinerariifolium]
MNCIEEIAKDAKVIEIDNQLLVLIKRQVDIELMLEEKFRDLCEEVLIHFEDMIIYLTRKISRRFTTLYYTLPPNNALSGFKQIKNDYDTNVMYDIARVAGKIQLFVSHHQIDLSTVLIPNDGSLEEAWEEQEHFKDEETKLSCPKINLSTVVKSNKGSSDKSFQSLIYLHEMQKRKQKIEEMKVVQHQDIKKHMY